MICEIWNGAKKMIFWYDHLYMDEAVSKHEKKCKKIVESRNKWQMLPWKKSYFIITLANNKENLFEIMNTSQMFFRYYEYTNVYILGVAKKYESAVEIFQNIMTEGYGEDSAFDPRSVFTKDRFVSS